MPKHVVIWFLIITLLLNYVYSSMVKLLRSALNADETIAFIFTHILTLVEVRKNQE